MNPFAMSMGTEDYQKKKRVPKLRYWTAISRYTGILNYTVSFCFYPLETTFHVKIFTPTKNHNFTCVVGHRFILNLPPEKTQSHALF